MSSISIIIYGCYNLNLQWNIDSPFMVFDEVFFMPWGMKAIDKWNTLDGTREKWADRGEALMNANKIDAEVFL